MSLKYTLVVRHPETGEPVALLKGEPVPDWAKDLVQPDDVEPEPKKSTTRKTSK